MILFSSFNIPNLENLNPHRKPHDGAGGEEGKV